VLARQLAADIDDENGLADGVQARVIFLLRQELAVDTWDAKAAEAFLDATVDILPDIDLSRLTRDERAELIRLVSQGKFSASLPLLAKGRGISAPDAIKEFLNDEGVTYLPPLVHLVGLLHGLEQVHAAWRSSIDVDLGKIDVASFVRSLIGKSGPLVLLCEGHAHLPACQVVDAFSKAKSGGTGVVTDALTQIQPLLAFAGRGEYTEAAQMGVRYVFQLVDDEDSEVSVYERFAESVVTYVLETADEKTPSAAARVAFKTAAVDMIQHLSQGGGLRRRAWSLGILLPDLALRTSWSPSYINKDSSPTRVLASANFITFRIPVHRSQASYVGVHLSLIDPLAPLSELVLRKDDGTHYSKVNNLFANFFTPRVEVVAGSPALSEHLAVSGGLSLRLAAPTPDDAATKKNNGEPSYKYDLVWHAQEGDKAGLSNSLWLRFLEFGFAVKYVI
jgi:hypothetical protein